MRRSPSYQTKQQGGATVVRSDAFQWSDAALVTAVRAGDQHAKAALFDRYGAYVRGIVVRLLGLQGDVPDVVHDVFVAALEDIERLKNEAALKSWLTSIAVFTVRHHIRTKSRRRWLRFMGPEEVPEQPAPHADPETQRALTTAYALLGQLDVDDRMAFTLRYLEDMELQDVADACQVSLATAKRRIKRAEAAFRSKAQTNPALCAWLDSTELERKS